MTSHWPDNCDAIMWIMISNSLDIDFIHGDIHGRSCKKSLLFRDYFTVTWVITWFDTNSHKPTADHLVIYRPMYYSLFVPDWHGAHGWNNLMVTRNNYQFMRLLWTVLKHEAPLVISSSLIWFLPRSSGFFIRPMYYYLCNGFYIISSIVRNLTLPRWECVKHI